MDTTIPRTPVPGPDDDGHELALLIDEARDMINCSKKQLKAANRDRNRVYKCGLPDVVRSVYDASVGRALQRLSANRAYLCGLEDSCRPRPDWFERMLDDAERTEPTKENPSYMDELNEWGE